MGFRIFDPQEDKDDEVNSVSYCDCKQHTGKSLRLQISQTSVRLQHWVSKHHSDKLEHHLVMKL